MLSISLSASQNLYTRRGTLVGLSGRADNVFGNDMNRDVYGALFLTGRLGDIDIERPRAFPPRSRRDSIPVPENLISESDQGLGISPITRYIFCCCTLGWNCGLDGGSKARIACMDRTLSEHQAQDQHEFGMRIRFFVDFQLYLISLAAECNQLG